MIPGHASHILGKLETTLQGAVQATVVADNGGELT